MKTISDELHQIKMQQASNANSLNVLTHEVNRFQGKGVVTQTSSTRGRGGKKEKVL